jgi:galactokinase
MDQFISAYGKRGHGMLLDCRSHATVMVPLADAGVSLLIASKLVLALGGGASFYSARVCMLSVLAYCRPCAPVGLWCVAQILM